MVAGTLVLLVASWVILAGLSLQFYGTPVTPLEHTIYHKLRPRAQLINQCIFVAINILIWVSLYCGIVLHRHNTAARMRQAQLAEALQAAELRLLKSQLNPHFLFNALNSVRALIAADPEKAQDSVTRLARTLRYTLAAGEEDCVTLARELEMVDDYLGLEALRLANRLTVERNIDPEALTARVPAMMLQTLVENAIKHGIAELKRGGALQLAIRREAGELTLEITNACPNPAPGRDAGQGIGLKNLSERLRLLFGPAASVRLDLSVPGRARAEVRLPT
jgi:LytS/YehU family sensor histidine kinase